MRTVRRLVGCLLVVPPHHRCKTHRSLLSMPLGWFMLVMFGCGGGVLRGTEIRDVGRGTEPDIASAVWEELANHGYVVSTYTETSTSLYWETSWLFRDPFEDETGSGVDRIRTRVKIRARRSASDLFLVTLRMENFATGLFAGDQWHPMPSTEAYKDHVRSLTDAIQIRIDAGMRTRPGG